MDLEKLSANLRPRQQVEAMDLGVSMVRALFAPVVLPWLLVVVPVSAVLFWLLPGIWGLALVWWLLPFFDRLPLFVLSRGLFGDVPSVARTVREVPRLWFRFWLLPLTIGRLSPFRCFHLPVSELEQQRGKRYADRCRVLRIDQDRGVLALYAMCGVIVLALWGGALLGLIRLYTMFYHPSESPWFSFLASEDPYLPPWVFGLGVACILIVEPFHVASGFALYLNRRLHLEGWDIELTFRRLAKRIESLHAGMRTAGLLLCACLLGATLPGQDPGATTASPPAERAEQPSQQQPGDQEPQRAIKKVFAHPDFGSERTVSRWKRIGSGPKISGGPNISGLGFLGEALRLLMWAVFIGAVAWLIWLVVKSVDKMARADRAVTTERGPPPAEVMGLDVRPESLPDDPATEAWKLWQAGDAAGCLSLLYRAALADLIHEHELSIGRSATEADCLELIRAANLAGLFRYFQGLTVAWQTCAYAQRLPAEATAQRLCQDWPRHFRRAA